MQPCTLKKAFLFPFLLLFSSPLPIAAQVVYGTALLTPAIQATGGALIAGKVPSDWFVTKSSRSSSMHPVNSR